MRRRLTHCQECERETSHTILRCSRTTKRYDEGEQTLAFSYEIARCDGCRTLTFRRQIRDSASPHDLPDEEVYPPRFNLTPNVWLPHTVRAIQRETVIALASQQPILAAVGIRGILETVCKHRKPTAHSTLEAAIDELVAAGLITQSRAGVLHTIRRVTNHAIHEAKAPSTQTLQLAMRIVEHLLDSVYRVPFESEMLERHAAHEKATTRAKAGGIQ